MEVFVHLATGAVFMALVGTIGGLLIYYSKDWF